MPTNKGMTGFESRIFTGSELRAAESQDEMALAGYAATFGTLSHDLGGFRERLATTAFDRALREKQDVRCLFSHDQSKILGRVSAGTLQLSTDARGLHFRCQLDPNQQWHRDLWQSVKREDCTDCSFAFTVNGPDGEEWDEGTDEDGKRFARRTLKDVDLMDCSIVAWPAYPGTAVAARNLSSAVRNARQVLSHDAWKRMALQRSKEIGRRIIDDNVRDAVERSKKTGFKQVRIGPGEADVRFEVMTEEEFDQHLRNRADELGVQIRGEQIASEHEEPTVTWDERARLWVPTIEKLLKEN